MIVFDSVFLMRRQKQIFSNLTFRVEKNEKRILSGKSGLGKTTLLKLVLGFESADSGRVLVNKNPVDPIHIKQIRNQIFYLSQDIDLKKGRLSDFLDEIFLVCTGKAFNPFQMVEWLSFFELDKNLLGQDSTDLSGGERQRMGLVIGFMLDRPIWLLDEPTSALDQKMKEKTARKILGLEKTMVIVSHDPVWQQSNTVCMERW
ncbi:MAG: ATP-binding cassette domain-containing protein [Pseudomonadota bacterium]